MPSQFFGLNIAYTGLLASNAALNTTSNNIANVQTDGYSRQQVNQQAAQALRVFQTYGCAGAGVETLAIERVRDEFYDTKYWNNNSDVGEYSIKQYYMKQVENYFADSATTKGFTTIFDQMMSALQEVMKTPSSTDAKAQFISATGSLAEYFNNLSGNLEKLQKDTNQELKLKVDEMNSLASEIASLNKQINVIELTGATANELRDRRTLLVDQLSEIVDVETAETPIYDTNYPDRETGAYRYMVTIAGGQTLVDGSEFNGLECVARKNYENINQSDIDGLYDVYWENGQQFNLYSDNLGGALRGLIEMRDGNNGENFTGTVSAIGKDATGNDTVTVDVTAEYLKDLNKCTLSENGGKIALGNQVFYYDSWSYTKATAADGTESYSYTFTLSSDAAKNQTQVTNNRIGKSATVGSSVDYQGVPYYMEQMNEWVRIFSQHVNDVLGAGYDSYGNQGNYLLTGDMATTNAQYDFSAATTPRYDKDKNITVKVNDESYYRLTAANFSILAALDDDADLLATRVEAASGTDDNSILTKLKQMLTTKTEMSFRGASAGEFLECILADIGLNAQNANTLSSNYKNIAASIDTQRISISGVDEEEEAVNLVKFQNGYNLASKMIQTLTEIYDRLILETGV